MNCHLLVPDLFWPAAAGIEPYRGLELPALESLLARGRSRKTAGRSLERWLAGAYHVVPQHDLPLAPLALRGDGAEPGPHWWMRADPVHLRVQGDRLMLADASRFTVTVEEARDYLAVLNRHFGADGITLVAPHPHRWYLRTAVELRVRTTPTAEVAGKGIEPFLPAGEDGAYWRKAVNEVQMLLHEHPCNAAREARGELPINSVWFWGAGRAAQLAAGAPYAVIWCRHPLARGLAAAAGTEARPLPESVEPVLQALRAAPREQVHLVVLETPPAAAYGDITAWRESVLALERRWFAPLVAAVQDGALDAVTLDGLGPDFGYTAGLVRQDRMKFWRWRRPLHAYAE